MSERDSSSAPARDPGRSDGGDDSASTSGAEDDARRLDHRDATTTKKKKTQQPQAKKRASKTGPSSALDQLPVDGAVDGVSNALGSVAGQALDGQQQGGGKSDTLRLRLDLNLDIEITLKARIHGDLELALLYVPCAPFCP